MAVTKEHILSEIRRTALQNGGSALGIDRFLAETGIKVSDWRGRFWARWSDAVAEAGFEPNQLNPPRDEQDLLARLTDLVKELGRFPVQSEMKLKAGREPSFPHPNTLFARFGNKQSLHARLRKHCEELGATDVLSLLPAPEKIERRPDEDVDEPEFGFVYILKSGRHYKIGRTNAVGRRERELAIQLPDKANVVHSIRTDDPEGIESYWHRRFEPRRKNGEWFALTAQDVAAFRRRKFM